MKLHCGHLHTWASIEGEDNIVKQMHYNKNVFQQKFAQNKKMWKHIACIKQKDKKNIRMNVLRKTCKEKMTQKNWMQMNEQRTNPKKNPMKSF
jgi:hypothetical protein